MYSPSQIKAILITPMLSGSVSAIASGTLITAILQSETKLSAPSKRILFGLCIHDCIMSIASALSSLPVPRELGLWGAMGNVHSCDFQGCVIDNAYILNTVPVRLGCGMNYIWHSVFSIRIE